MYGKLFESIYDGTLVEDWLALITFQQMIILCNSDGVLDMTIGAMARRTGIPKENLIHGIKVLESPDPESRTPNEQGKRIIRIDEHRAWGWVIVNHKHYRDLRTSDDRREYMRKYMRNKRNNDKLTDVNESLQSQQLTKLANKDTDTYTDTKKKRKTSFSPPSISEITEYCQERKNNIDPQSFLDHYDANGWVRGKTKIKCWKACVRTWEKRNNENKPKQENYAEGGI